jgi:hypothetical protein
VLGNRHRRSEGCDGRVGDDICFSPRPTSSAADPNCERQKALIASFGDLARMYRNAVTLRSTFD